MKVEPLEMRGTSHTQNEDNSILGRDNSTYKDPEADMHVNLLNSERPLVYWDRMNKVRVALEIIIQYQRQHKVPSL